MHELESQSADTVSSDIDDTSDPETSEPIASAQARQREGLPPQYRMRAERHYVDHLSAPSSSVPVQLIPISQLSPRPQAASKDLDALVRSIRAHGIIQPLLVRRDRTGYHVIAGSKRLGAAITAGLAEVPCIVLTYRPAPRRSRRRNGCAANAPARAGVGRRRIAEGVTAIADDLSRIQATWDCCGIRQPDSSRRSRSIFCRRRPGGRSRLANVASFLSGGKYPDGQTRPLSCRRRRHRRALRAGVPAVAPSIHGPSFRRGRAARRGRPGRFALTSAIIVTLALLEHRSRPAPDITHRRSGARLRDRGDSAPLVPFTETAERIPNQALSAPAAGNTGLGALALSHVTALYGGASELLVTDEPGSTLRLHLRTRARLEAEAQPNGDVGVVVELPKEIVGLAFDSDAGEREPPVLGERLRVFALQVEALATLSHGRFDRDGAPRIDRIGGPAQKRFRDAAIRRE